MNNPPSHSLTGSVGFDKGKADPKEETKEEEEEHEFSTEDEENLGSFLKPSTGQSVKKAVPPSNEVKKPAPEESSEPKEEKKEINTRFKDLHETGRWGNISKKEIFIAAAVLVLIVLAVIGVVVYLVTKDDGSSTPSSTSPPLVSPPTPSPTEAPALFPEEELAFIRSRIAANPNTVATLDVLPDDALFYQNKYTDPTQPVPVRAMSWMLYADPVDLEDTLMERYALANLFFSTNGNAWTDNTNWMSDQHMCTWTGVVCDRFGQKMEAFDMSNNNMAGTIPHELNFLQGIRDLTLSNNALTGTLPGLPLGSLPELSIIYVDNNQLTGEISIDLRANEVLNTLFLQQNLFTGDFPFEFCPRFVGQEPPLIEFGMDCDELRCFCCDANNCF